MWLKGMAFDVILRLGNDWALGHKKPKSWWAIHLHDKKRFGWLMTFIHERGMKDTCEVCGKKFPKRVIGMLNMMDGLS